MPKRIILIIAVLMVSLLSVFSASAEACTCAFSAQPRQAYWSADTVFVGQVIDISIIPWDLGEGRSGLKQKLVRFSIEQPFRGADGKTKAITSAVR